MAREEVLLALIEAVVSEVDYDLGKDMFEYYEEDYNYDGSIVKSTRERLIRVCSEIAKDL